MTNLCVRRLEIDLDTAFPVRWAGGDAFCSALFNALSMCFPVGEQYFIESLRAALPELAPERRDALAIEIRDFVAQEATHRYLHGRFNSHVEAQGMVNTVESRAARRKARAARNLPVRIRVAATAATEHLTSTFSEWMLRRPDVLAGAEPRLEALWMWHAAEESEHRSTAFDVYMALAGTARERVRVFRISTALFLLEIARQTVRNLWEDGALLRPSTWRSAARLLFGADGFLRGNVANWRTYLAPDFHPSAHGTERGARWLAEHRDAYIVIERASA